MNLCPLGVWPFVILNIFVLGMLYANYCSFGVAILEKNIFKHFPIYHYVKC